MCCSGKWWAQWQPARPRGQQITRVGPGTACCVSLPRPPSLPCHHPFLPLCSSPSLLPMSPDGPWLVPWHRGPSGVSEVPLVAPHVPKLGRAPCVPSCRRNARSSWLLSPGCGILQTTAFPSSNCFTAPYDLFSQC
ncbi:Uncharacterised protein [Chlamydia abortus]|nr:Uncharacterised protein [Chlamydia abortus]SGA33977.1 Uncharacterised protein [Chlamydia abortus]